MGSKNITRRGAISFVSGLLATKALVSFDEGMSFVMPKFAFADGIYDSHLHADDYDGIDAPTLWLDTSRYVLSNVSLVSSSSGVTFDVDSDTGWKIVHIYKSGSFNDGDIIVSSADANFRVPGCITDGENFYDLLIDMHFRDVKFNDNSGTTHTLRNPSLALNVFFKEPIGSMFCLQSYFRDRPWNGALIGTKCDVRIRVVQPNTSTVVPGSFVYYIEDVDQPDKFVWNHTGPYTEGVDPGSGMSTEIHMRRDAVGYLQWVDNGVYSTQDTTGNEYLSAFAVSCNSDFSYTWHGSDCGSGQLMPFPASWIKITKQISGQFADANQSFNFSVSVSDRSNPVTFSLKGGQSYTIKGVDPGSSYTVTETSVDGWQTTWSGQAGRTVEAQGSLVFAYNRRREFKLTLTKTSDWQDLVTNHALYSLAGATFVVRDETGKVWYTVQSSANGSVATVDLPTGHTYTITETVRSPGHRLPNPASKSISVGLNDETARAVSFENPTIWQNLDMLASKIDDDRNTASGQGDAVDWSALRVEMEYFDNHSCSGSAKVTTVWAADSVGRVDFDTATPVSGTWPYRRNNKNVLPLGSYRVREIAAPVGYRVNGTWQRRDVTESGIVNM